MTPEKRIQNKILKYLDNLEKSGYPVFYQRRQAGGYSYKKGIPDIYCVVNGKHIEIEVKAPGGHLSPMQEKFRDLFKRNNVEWICVDNVEEFKLFINKFIV